MPPPLAVKVVLVVVQFKAKLPEIEAVGAVLSKVVTAVLVAEQPFEVVTVTVNVPAVVIALEAAAVEPSLQA